jgi:tRNA threonylcarbamoyladenosine biosynthesis protein TsaE
MTITYELENLKEVASRILENITHKTLLFYGEMGSGKTTLIKELASQMGFDDVVNSPTFSLVNEYGDGTNKLYHFDFYRINTPEEALDMGVEEYFYSGHWVMVEWPDKIQGLLPNDFHRITIEKLSENSRTLTLD